jgi:acyl dehydratase
METVELARAPGLAGLYARALAAALPGRGGAHDRVPQTGLALRGVRADGARVVAYARVCGFTLTGTLPVTYPHVLAFPLALKLMTSADFPFPATGVVHLANRIEQRRPLAADEPMDLTVHVENLRPHERGRQVDVVAVATVDGAEVWRDVSTYLRREGARSGRATGPGREASPDGPPPEPTAVWRVGAGTGRAYAEVSGDRNPIHLSTLAAKAFGFKRQIAHGMWSKARCLAQLGPRLPDAYTVEVAFRAPVLLPSTVHFSAAPEPDGWRFAVHGAKSGRSHLSGTVTRA